MFQDFLHYSSYSYSYSCANTNPLHQNYTRKTEYNIL